jgi:hypothetical protein
MLVDCEVTSHYHRLADFRKRLRLFNHDPVQGVAVDNPDFSVPSRKRCRDVRQHAAQHLSIEGIEQEKHVLVFYIVVDNVRFEDMELCRGPRFFLVSGAVFLGDSAQFGRELDAPQPREA